MPEHPDRGSLHGRGPTPVQPFLCPARPLNGTRGTTTCSADEQTIDPSRKSRRGFHEENFGSHPCSASAASRDTARFLRALSGRDEARAARAALADFGTYASWVGP